MPFTLQSVAIVLRNEREADALEQAGPLISQFIGPSPHLSLSAACSFRSTTLLDWIWACSCPTHHDSPAAVAHTGDWALIRFLRSDEFYSRWQFVEVARVAVERGDTELLQWLFDHFQDTVVPSDVVRLAVRKGDLSVLQFLVTNANTSQGIRVEWDPSDVLFALEIELLATAHWLYHQHAPLGTMADEVRDDIIIAAVDAGDWTFCESLLPRGRCVLDYADFCIKPEIVEWKLDCGYYQRDRVGAAYAILDLISTDRLDLIQRISSQLNPPPQHGDWVVVWREILVEACSHSNLDVTKFLVLHPTGQQVINDNDRSSALLDLMRYPAAKGNVNAMEYLYNQGAIGPFGDVMVSAISNGQAEAIMWLIERYPRAYKIPEYCFMHEAARRGRVDMLQLFQSLKPSDIPGLFTPASPPPLFAVEEDNRSARVFVKCSDRHRKITPTLSRYRYIWAPTDPMDDAAANGQLQAVKWLHANRTEGCTTAAMDEAAANGYLDVVKWLHANRSEGCTSNAIDFAAESGHLEIVQWLHANTTAGCSTAAMDQAAAGGHLNTLKWLMSNRSEGCTAQAIETAVINGHLGIASSLMRRFPKLKPANFSPLLTKNKFEALLFLHVHYPEAFTPDFVQNIDLFLRRQLTPSDVHILDWLKHHYPVPSVPQGQGDRAQGLAGRFAENIAHQLARQLGRDLPVFHGQQEALQQGNAPLVMDLQNLLMRALRRHD